MFWVRALFYCLPLFGMAGFSWLFAKVRDMEYRRKDQALVYLTEKPIGELNPLLPLDQVSREVADLIFDPLLVRDENMRLRPHLLEEWSFETVVAVRFRDAGSAESAEGQLGTGNGGNLSFHREKEVLVLGLEGFDPGKIDAIMAEFSTDDLAELHAFRLRFWHSARPSIEDFLENNPVRDQVRMLDFPGERTANIFVEGDAATFLAELRKHFLASTSYTPEILDRGPVTHTVTVTMELKLRSGLQWHDGRDITSDDLVFSIRELTREGSAYSPIDTFASVDELVGVDPLRLRISFSDPPATLLEGLASFSLLPSHLLGPLDQRWWSNFFRNPVGSGPYRFRGRIGGGVELEANPSYFLGAPFQERVVYRHLPKRGERLEAIRFGEVDVFVPEDGAGKFSENLTEVRYPPRIQHFVAWNLDEGKFRDEGLRRALALAVDLDLILEDGPSSYQESTESLFFPGAPFTPELMNLPGHDPSAARDLLRRNGYTRRTGERFYSKNGEPLSFSLIVNGGNREHLRMAERLASLWRNFGIGVGVDPRSWPDIVSGCLIERRFEAILLGWELPLSRDGYPTWHSSQIGEGKGNFPGLRDAETDALLVRMRETIDDGEIREVATALQRRIAELQPCLFLCNSGRRVVFRDDAVCLLRSRDGGLQIRKGVIGEGREGYGRFRPWWVRADLAAAAGF